MDKSGVYWSWSNEAGSFENQVRRAWRALASLPVQLCGALLPSMPHVASCFVCIASLAAASPVVHRLRCRLNLHEPN